MSDDIPDIDPDYIHGKVKTPSGVIPGRAVPVDVLKTAADESRWPRNRNELAQWTSFFEAILGAGRPSEQAAYDADQALAEWRKRMPGVKKVDTSDDPLSSPEKGPDPEPRSQLDPSDPLF